MSRLNELRMIARVAQMYHVEKLRQTEIARHLHLSQATVSRMLKRAIEEEIVRTTVVSPTGTYTELETSLRRSYGLSEAIVVECSEDRESEIMARIGEAAAHFLEATLQNGEIIGVSSWSETILKMVENIHPMKTGRAAFVVQTLGGMGDPTVQIHANQLTARLARLTGAEARLLSTPGVAPSLAAKNVLLEDQFVQETQLLFDKITLSIVGIGAMQPSNMLARSGNVFSSQELADIKEAGGVGDVCLRFFDAKGGLIKTPLDQRVIGMPIEDLAKTARVLALAGGQSKTEAIDAALRTGALDVLITDRFTAQRLHAKTLTAS